MVCFKYCIRCLGKVPDTSLVATILCFPRVALFCGCARVAFVVMMVILDPGFSTNTSNHSLLSEVIQLMQYVIYGIMSFFFLYEIILSITWEVKELYREFETTAYGQCIPGMFVFLTYVLGVAWLFCALCLYSTACDQLMKSSSHPDQWDSNCGTGLCGYLTMQYIIP